MINVYACVCGPSSRFYRVIFMASEPCGYCLREKTRKTPETTDLVDATSNALPVRRLKRPLSHTTAPTTHDSKIMYCV